MVEFTVTALADKPEMADICAAWSYGEWGCHIENGRKLNDVINDYRMSTTANKLPKTWLAFVDKKIAGMIRLKKEDHPDRKDLSPWLGSLFVHNQFRRKGIASKLCRHVENEARLMGYKSLYLFTGSAEGFYQKLDYKKIGMVRDTTGIHPDGEPLLMKAL